jgi:hypothetical protein
MKKLLLTIVQVKKIDFYDCPIAVDKFSENNLDYAAQYSLQLGGFVVPPTLLRIGTELNPFYRILAGHFQCYAALKAYKLDPLRGETVPAIVIREDDPNLDILLHQLNYINYGDS